MKKKFFLFIILFVMNTFGCQGESNALKLDNSSVKVEYMEGEVFNPKGLIIEYNNTIVSDYTFMPKDELTLNDKEIIIYCNINNQMYTEKIAITVSGTLPDKLDTPIVTINDNIISYNSVKNANNYYIYLNNELLIKTSDLSYKLQNLNENIYNVYVIASYENSDNKIMSEKSNIYQIVYTNKLATPIITLIDNITKWNEVDNAISYDIFLNDELVKTQKETTYEINTLESAIYKVKVQAIASDSLFNSDYSNTCIYTKTIDDTLPIIIYSENKPLVMNKSNIDVLDETLEISNNYLESDALLLEKIANYYYIKRQDGTYLCFIPPMDVTDNKIAITSGKLDYEDSSYKWLLTLATGTSNEYYITNQKAIEINESNAYYLYNNSNIITLINRNSPSFQKQKALFRLLNVSVENEFSESQIHEENKFDITKPIIASFKANGMDYIIGIVNETLENNDQVNNHLVSNIPYSKNLLQESFINSTFIIEKMEGYVPFENGYLENGGDFYRIRLGNGKYLGMLKGSYIGNNSRDYFTCSDYNESDWWQYWQIKFVSEDEIILYNLGKNYDWWGNVNCAMNRDSNSQLGPNMYEYVESYKNDFILVLRNIDVDVNNNYLYTDLSGNNVIENFGTKTTFKMSGDDQSAYLQNSGLSFINDSNKYQWTFEKVEELTNINAYRLRAPNGKYLSYNTSTQYQLSDLNTNLNTNEGKALVFIFNAVSGLTNAYRIGNLFYGGNTYKDNVKRYYLLTACTSFLKEGEHNDGVFTYYGQIDQKLILEQIWIINQVNNNEK